MIDFSSTFMRAGQIKNKCNGPDVDSGTQIKKSLDAKSLRMWDLLRGQQKRRTKWCGLLVYAVHGVVGGYWISKWTKVDSCWAMSLKCRLSSNQLSWKTETWEGRLFHWREELRQGCWWRRFHFFSPGYLGTFVGLLVLLCCWFSWFGFKGTRIFLRILASTLWR